MGPWWAGGFDQTLYGEKLDVLSAGVLFKSMKEKTNVRSRLELALQPTRTIKVMDGGPVDLGGSRSQRRLGRTAR